MAKVRQDAWSHEDDLLLAETVLRHVREGSTQLNAFEEVGDKLNRTSAACGFRWNAEVRNKYIDAMELAKRQRKERKRTLAKKNQQQKQVKQQSHTSPFSPLHSASQTENTQIDPVNQPEDTPLTMDSVIQFLQDFNRNYHMTNQSKVHVESVEQDNQTLRDQVKELEEKLAETEEQLATIQEDYQTFIQIMDRARKMTVLDDQGSLQAPAFRMDKNGNLEQLVQGLNQ